MCAGYRFESGKPFAGHRIWLRIVLTSVERWLSGLKRAPGKRVYLKSTEGSNPSLSASCFSSSQSEMVGLSEKDYDHTAREKKSAPDIHADCPAATVVERIRHCKYDQGRDKHCK